MAPVPVSKPASSPNPSRGETPGTRHASNEERRGERNGKSEKDREREREREKEREKEDPKHVGPWRIGKTIGKGSSGEFLLTSCLALRPFSFFRVRDWSQGKRS